MTIKLHGLSESETAVLLPDGLITLAYRGSIAHGLYVPKAQPDSIDDKDLQGVYVAPLAYYLGLQDASAKGKGVWERKQGEWDVVCYEVSKMIGLLLKGNPNVLSLLWTEDQHTIMQTPMGQKLRDNRNLFVSKQVYYSFAGYAHGQAHRMTHMAFFGYMGAKRKELVEKYHYDVKNAAHLIRLLRMCIEFLSDGELRVLRKHDTHDLLAIKRGEWTLEKVQDESDRLFTLAQEAYVRSPLPAQPEREKAERLCMEIIMEYHGITLPLQAA